VTTFFAKDADVIHGAETVDYRQFPKNRTQHLHHTLNL
jgi:hypothetical protein